MKDRQLQKSLPSADSASPISLEPPKNSNFRFLAVFLICCAILIAAFAASAMLVKGSAHGGFLPFWKENSSQESPEGESSTEDSLNEESPKEPTKIPQGALVIVSKDLSCPELGESYIHNETPYRPNLTELLEKELLPIASDGLPRVLVLHTHTSEGYLEDGTKFLDGAPGDLTYSKDETQNVLAVGQAFVEALNEKGITAIHCTVMHDTPSLGGSYERSAETVRRYLEQYPTITYVIDLHRDAMITADGEYIRTKSADPSVAQVMAVVGSDCNGTRHELWEENLALALQLRRALNQKLPDACRPVSLRKASYNQELAPRFLLLEIGSGANTVKEAQNAARLVGETLADLLYAR